MSMLKPLSAPSGVASRCHAVPRGPPIASPASSLVGRHAGALLGNDARLGSAAPLLHARRCEQPSTSLRRVSVAAAGTDGAEGGGEENYADVAARLNTLLETPRINGADLRGLVLEKWGRSYDVILRKSGNRMYLQVMWKFLEQQSFPLTEAEYMQQLDAVAEYITEWGVVDTVKRGIASAHKRGPGMTGGRAAKCIAIPLDVDLSESRRSEFA